MCSAVKYTSISKIVTAITSPVELSFFIIFATAQKSSTYSEDFSDYVDVKLTRVFSGRTYIFVGIVIIKTDCLTHII